MKISTKGRYALRLLVDLAQHEDNGFITLKDIASRQNISKKYLEQIVPVLNKANIVQSNRGFQGGYRLAKHPQEITVYDVLTATEGSLSCVTCLDAPTNTCPRKQDCTTLFVWEGLNQVINNYLKSISLLDILNHEQSFDYII
jgi:Rrf2 family protein